MKVALGSKVFTKGGACSVLATMAVLTCSDGYARNYDESYDTLRTPGVGFQESISHKPTFANYSDCGMSDNSENLDAAGLKSGAKYVRLLWQDLETSDNNFTQGKQIIDQILRCAGQEGKAVDFRVHMAWPEYPTDHNWRFGWNDDLQRSVGLPSWLVNKPGMYPYEVTEGANVGTYFLANWNDWELRRQHDELITWLGNNYDGHKHLNSVDIGSVGFFGEWHNDIGNRLPDYMLPSVQQQLDIVSLYEREFPNTPLIALEEPYELSRGGNGSIGGELLNKPNIGWRGDSWGSWYHTQDRYLPQHRSYLGSTWKKAPISTEISGAYLGAWENNSYTSTSSNWLTNGVSNFETLTNFVADWHTSTINSKGGPLAVAQYPAAQKLARKLGFRFVLNKATHSNEITAGSALNVSMQWNNKGVAPQYRDFRVAFRLRNSNNVVVGNSTVRSATSVKGWLPNQLQQKNVVYNVPSNIPAGDYTLETGIVFHSANDVVLPIAVNQRRNDLWVPVDSLRVTGGGATATGSQVYFSNVEAGGGDRNSDGLIWRLTDGQVDFTNDYGYWSNGGDVDRAYVNLYFNSWKKVTAVEFSDRYARRVHVGVFNNSGSAVWTGVFNTNGSQTTTIDVPNQWGTRVSVWADTSYSSNGNLWFTPYEIKVLAAD